MFDALFRADAVVREVNMPCIITAVHLEWTAHHVSQKCLLGTMADCEYLEHVIISLFFSLSKQIIELTCAYPVG